MNKVYRFVVLVIVTLTFFSFVSEHEVVEKQTLLWKIEGKNLSKPSYLFGTMHLIQKEYFYFPNSLEKLIKKSDVIVTEIALDELGNQEEALKHIYLKDGNLMDFFTDTQEDTIYQWAESSLKMSKSAFDAAFGKMKPFVLVQTMTQLEFVGKTESYEYTIKDLGEKYKKKFLGLETVEKQISFFDQLSKEKQAQMVLQGLKDKESSKKLLVQMQGMYRRQQLDSLYQLTQMESGVLQEEEATFLSNRNQNWIPQIESIIPTNQAFIAVGAAHLAGSKGVIQLLRAKGYTVTPIEL